MMLALRSATLVAGSLAACLLVSACSKEPTAQAPGKQRVEIADSRMVLPIVPGSAGAAYFTVNNGTDRAIRIAAIDVDGADMAMIHKTVNANGRSSMEMLMSIDVPAHQSVSFAPGGLHVMLTGLSPKLVAGSKARMTLTYEDGGKAQVDMPVVSGTDAAE